MKNLTKAEEQVMQIVWKLGEAYLKDVVDEFNDPKPHSNTVATLLKILVEKQYVETIHHGRIFLYKPLISKETYSKGTMKTVVENFFEGSFSNAVSFLIDNKDLKIDDLELILQQLKNKK
jgi:BlaI family transcriptional regulator, penicillinase repressor